MKKIAFHNLGCKVNSYEMEYMQQSFAENGYEIVPFVGKADIYVVNTCTVTNIADRKSRQMLHKAKSLNPDAIVVAVGCYVDTDREGALQDEAVDLLVGNNRKGELLAIIDDYLAGKRTDPLAHVPALRPHPPYEEFRLKRTREHTRVSLKIQDGCDQFCSYCIIPYSRGTIRSRKPEDVVEEAALLSENGNAEIVLTGIHLSSYGLDFGENHRSYNEAVRAGENTNRALLDVIRKTAALPQVKRVRLGSLEPRIITEEFLQGLRETEAFCPHFHLSLQSGSDAVLKRMNRHYTTKEYADRAARIRAYFPDAAITTDVIVGFPQETEAEFEETRRFLDRIDFYETHIFKYSRRRGTAADRMRGQLTEKVKAERSQILIKAGEKREEAFRRRFLNRPVSVLAETPEVIEDRRFLTGFTKEYVRVALPAEIGRVGEIVTVVPTRLQKDGILVFSSEK